MRHLLWKNSNPHRKRMGVMGTGNLEMFLTRPQIEKIIDTLPSGSKLVNIKESETPLRAKVIYTYHSPGAEKEELWCARMVYLVGNSGGRK